ncbi:tryptophan synthase subunit beta like protein [Alishewanella tabrizica]|uniref:Tryptophan synthase subunit beta like protein n=1 Tax=Alishewanella tabrizica TaxID=671278 RepID=A0ABQ2WPH6_9ALTE|nr:tryptophan synthase subunit beta like protein [Alishewanella tabrizica]GGW67025.1 hypothetical protein GCM10008111_23820 [Alishewanella tabrizica]
MYVTRNTQGEICAISVDQSSSCEEYIDNQAPELQRFLKAQLPKNVKNDSHDAAGRQLQNSDGELARVLEDVIDALTMKGILTFTDLPIAAQEKLLQRKLLRKRLGGLELISNDDDHFMP